MYQLQVDDIPPKFTVEKLEAHFTKFNRQKSTVNKVLCVKIEVLEDEKLKNGTQTCLLTFESRNALEEAAQVLISGHQVDKREIKLRIGMKKLAEKSAHTRDTSLVIKSMDLRCSEQDLISHIGYIFRSNFDYRREMAKWERIQLEKAGQKTKAKELTQFFILSCYVVRGASGISKGVAIVDLNCAEAAQVVRKGLHDRKLPNFVNTLSVESYQEAYVRKRSKSPKKRAEQQQRSAQSQREEEDMPTKLYAQHLPDVLSFEETYQLFSDAGVVISLKLHPSRQMGLMSASIVYRNRRDAQKAMNLLDSRVLMPGAMPIHVDYFNPDNRFPATQIGVSKQQLMTNSHYRILFLRGLDYNLTKYELTDICERYGRIDHLTLKTSLQPDGTKKSRGIAIVQYAKVEDAGRALKNLVFEEQLGDPTRVKIEFYESRESRDAHSKVNAHYALANIPNMNVREQLQPFMMVLKDQYLDQIIRPPSDDSNSQVEPEEFDCPDYVIRPFTPRFVPQPPPRFPRQMLPKRFDKRPKRVQQDEPSRHMAWQKRVDSKKEERVAPAPKVIEPAKKDVVAEDKPVCRLSMIIRNPSRDASRDKSWRRQPDEPKPDVSKLRNFAWEDLQEHGSGSRSRGRQRDVDAAGRGSRSRSGSTHFYTADYLKYLHKSPGRDGVSPAPLVVTREGASVERKANADEDRTVMPTLAALKLKKESTINEEQSFIEDSVSLQSPRINDPGSSKKSAGLGSDYGGLENLVSKFSSGDKHRSDKGKSRANMPHVHSSDFLKQLESPQKRVDGKAMSVRSKHDELHATLDEQDEDDITVSVGSAYSQPKVNSAGSTNAQKVGKGIAMVSPMKKVLSQHSERKSDQPEGRGRSRHAANLKEINQMIAKWNWDQVSEATSIKGQELKEKKSSEQQ